MSFVIKNIDLRIDSHEDLLNIHTLISSVKPDWPLEKVQLELFSEGTSNVLFAAFLEQPLTPDNCVLVRIFGYQTELYIDRDREASYLWFLNQQHFASELFCKFNNGICYGYLPGTTLNYDLISQPKYFKMVAEKIAQLHSIRMDEVCDAEFMSDTSPCVLNSALKFIGLISDGQPLNGDAMNCSNDVFPTKEYLIKEVSLLNRLFSTAKSPVRFCHNDLLFGNILLSPKMDSVHLIDFEYCGYNHVCYEIANHFCEYAGSACYNASRYPSRVIQLEWVETYLRAFKRYSDASSSTGISSIDADEAEAWLAEIQNFALASHLYWGAWSIVQSQKSKINFDYTKYALTRFNEYKKLKSALHL